MVGLVWRYIRLKVCLMMISWHPFVIWRNLLWKAACRNE